MEIVAVPAFSDNYIWLVHDERERRNRGRRSRRCRARARRGRRGAAGPSRQVWNTHWHPDHTGGNLAIKEATGAPISGPRPKRIRAATSTLDAKATEVRLGDHVGRVIEVPGHTLGHIASDLRRRGRGVRRRHLVRDGLRPAVRGHAGADVRARCSGSPRCPGTRGSIAPTNIRWRTRASRLTPSRDNAAIADRLDEVEALARRGRNHAADDASRRNVKPIPSFAPLTWRNSRACARKKTAFVHERRRSASAANCLEEVEMRTSLLLHRGRSLASCTCGPPATPMRSCEGAGASFAAAARRQGRRRAAQLPADLSAPATWWSSTTSTIAFRTTAPGQSTSITCRAAAPTSDAGHYALVTSSRRGQLCRGDIAAGGRT